MLNCELFLIFITDADDILFDYHLSSYSTVVDKLQEHFLMLICTDDQKEIPEFAYS